MENMIRHLIILKSHFLDVYSHKYTKIKSNSDYDLPFEKTLSRHNGVILINSVTYLSARY